MPTTSTRRIEAAAAVKAPSAAVKATADAIRRTKEGTATRNDAERLDALAQVKAGAIARERESALELVELVQAQIAAGVVPTAGAYILKYDAEGEPIDARDVVADALAPRQGKPSRRATRRALPWQITDTDLVRLAWGAVKFAARVAAGSSPETFSEAHAEAVAAMIAAAPASPCGCVATLARRYGSPLAWIAAAESGAARADCPRCNGARVVPQLDRRVVDLDAMAKAGRNAAQRCFEADRRAAPLDADELAAKLDADADAALDVASVTAAELADALALDSPAERAALLIECGGMTRAELARAHGITAESAKKNAQRGRKALAIKLTNPAAITEAARRIVANDPVDPAAAERAVRRLVAGTVHGGSRSLPAWPERFSGYDDENAPTFRYTGTGAATRQRTGEIHGGALAMPRWYKPAPAAPWSAAEYRAAAERAAIRRTLAQRKGRSWQPHGSQGLTVCTLPNMAQDAAQEVTRRMTALRSLMAAERELLADADPLRRAALLSTVAAAVHAGCAGACSTDALTRRASNVRAMLSH